MKYSIVIAILLLFCISIQQVNSIKQSGEDNKGKITNKKPSDDIEKDEIIPEELYARKRKDNKKKANKDDETNSKNSKNEDKSYGKDNTLQENLNTEKNSKGKSSGNQEESQNDKISDAKTINHLFGNRYVAAREKAMKIEQTKLKHINEKKVFAGKKALSKCLKKSSGGNSKDCVRETIRFRYMMISNEIHDLREQFDDICNISPRQCQTMRRKSCEVIFFLKFS